MKPILKVCVIAWVALTIGFIMGINLAKRVPLGAEESVAWHWKWVNEYNAYMQNPGNYTLDAQTGLSSSTPPYDPMPSLMALEAAGEIQCVDLVFPKVPNNRTINRHWMTYLSERNPTVPYASGNPGIAALRPTGTSPLYLKICFKPSALPDIQRLILELEELAAKEVPAD